MACFLWLHTGGWAVAMQGPCSSPRQCAVPSPTPVHHQRHPPRAASVPQDSRRSVCVRCRPPRCVAKGLRSPPPCCALVSSVQSRLFHVCHQHIYHYLTSKTSLFGHRWSWEAWRRGGVWTSRPTGPTCSQARSHARNLYLHRKPEGTKVHFYMLHTHKQVESSSGWPLRESF